MYRRADAVPVYGRNSSAPVYVHQGQSTLVYARHAKPVGRPAPPALLRRSRRIPESRPVRWALGTTLSLAVCVGLAISGASGVVTASSSQQIGQTSAPPDTASPYIAYDAGTPTAVPVVTTPQPVTTKATPAPTDTSEASGLAADGIPQTALMAYQDAADRENALDPTCGLTWPLLAGIGRVESDHGRFAGAVLHTDGVSTPKIIGIPLDGNGTALILDTDHGRLDGDTVYDRAVGPMQFIPSTWASYGVDANGDGIADPFNIFDAAATSADYLCAAGKDLTTVAGQTTAVRAYNDSDDYIRLVLKLEGIYATGLPGLSVPVLADTSPAPTGSVDMPPVNPGDGLSAPPPAGVPNPGSSTPPQSIPHPIASSTPPQSIPHPISSSAPPVSTPHPTTSSAPPPSTPQPTPSPTAQTSSVPISEPAPTNNPVPSPSG